MSRTVADKMGVRAGCRAYLDSAPDDAVRHLGLPELERADRLRGGFDYLHLFVTERERLDARFPVLRDHLRPGGMLWVSWPKGRRLGSDLTLPVVIEVGYDHGLVESKTLAVDDTWSAIKFTHPVPGRSYANSYGTLPWQRDEP